MQLSRRQARVPVPYGGWVGPDGRFHSVVDKQGHYSTARELGVPDAQIPNMLRNGWIRVVMDKANSTLYFEFQHGRVPTDRQMESMRQTALSMGLERLTNAVTNRSIYAHLSVHECSADLLAKVKMAVDPTFKPSVGLWQQRYPTK